MLHRWVCRAVPALAMIACAAGWPQVALANVYPAQLDVDTSAAGTLAGTVKVNYVLNEDADGTASQPGVKIEVRDAGNTVVRTVNIARQRKGKHVFEWDGRNDSGVRVANGSYSVRITAADFGYNAWSRISDDTNRQLVFFAVRGVAVNKNPGSKYYGRIYVSNATAGTNTTLLNVAAPAELQRPVGDGLYVLNADQSDALGQGDTALTGGIDWTLNNGTGAISPYRLQVGPDDRVYIADWSSASNPNPHNNIYRTDPDVSSGQAVLDTSVTDRESASSVLVDGTLEGADLRITYIDRGTTAPFQKFLTYNIGAGPLPAAPTPANFATVNPLITTFRGVWVDMDRGPDGRFYVLQNRSNGNEVGVAVISADGSTVLWNSLVQTRADSGNPSAVDKLRTSRSVAISPDGARMAVITDVSDVWILNLNYTDPVTQTTGLPNLATAVLLDTFPDVTIGRDVMFDNAGNLYAVSSGNAILRVFSPPDGPNAKTTSTSAFSLNKTGTGGLTITSQPQSGGGACIGGIANFSVGVSNTSGTVTYRWTKNGVEVGTNSPNLAVGPITAADDGATIQVAVSDDNGVVVSAPAVLAIGPTIQQPPASLYVCAGTNAAFSVTVAPPSSGTISYQWRKNAADLPGETGPTLTLNNVQVTDDGALIDVVVTLTASSTCSVTSPAATLTVRDGPVVSGISGNKTGPAGSQFTFSVIASGKGTIHYQWKKTVNSVTTNVGTDTPFLALNNVPCSDNGAVVSIDVTDDCGTRTATVGTMTVTNPPPEVCGNGLDDDCDGFADCEDSDCLSSCCNDPFADAEGAAGVGVNKGDGDVDMDDFAVFQLCFSPTGLPTDPAYCSCFDRTRDGRVDVQDFGDFLNCASGPAIQADANCDNYSTGDVVINEFQYDDYNDAEDDREFVELYNRGASPVDISGWVLKAPSMTGKDVIIPGGPDSGTTVVPANGYYVIGAVSVANVSQVPGTGLDLWDNDNEAIQLVDANGDVKDTVIYERYAGAPTGIINPEGAIWGEFGSIDGVDQMSWSRWVDGADTNDNGRDFGMRRETPGASNLGTGTVVAAYVPPDVNGLSAGTAVSGLVGSFVGGLVINPADTSTMLGADDVNPNVIPASPQGGTCIVAWDPSGGGNMVASNDIMTGNASYDLWVYFDTSDITVAGAESTAYGIMGTADYIFNFPDPGGTLFPATNVSSNGSTGLVWVYNKDNAGQVKRLFLVDAKGGGDSSPNGGSMDWTVHQTIDMSTVASGWYRLSISYTSDGSVTAIFNTQTFNFTTTAGLKGGFYVGYRESLSGTPASLRPPTFDRR